MTFTLSPSPLPTWRACDLDVSYISNEMFREIFYNIDVSLDMLTIYPFSEYNSSISGGEKFLEANFFN